MSERDTVLVESALFLDLRNENQSQSERIERLEDNANKYSKALNDKKISCDKLSNDVSLCLDKLESIFGASFLTRLSWLFFGVPR